MIVEKNKSKTVIEVCVKSHQNAFEASFDATHVDVLCKIVKEIASALKRGNKILLCGNGGSAADSQHIAAEFIGRFKLERESLPAIALTTDTSIITSIGNDYSYEQIFSRQVEGLARKGDVLIAISTSGNSKNVLEAARVAKSRGLKVIGFSGRTGGLLKDLSHIIFQAESDKTPHIQEMHIASLHAISEAVEGLLFPSR